MAPEANPLVRDTATPPIPEAKAWLSLYRGGRGAPIDMSQAVPGDPPAATLLAAMGVAAASPAAAMYGPILGDGPLREMIAARANRIYGADFSPGEAIVTAGCNLAFVTALMAVAGPGDAILLPTPWYFNHEMTARMQGVEARPLPCGPETGFVPDPDIAAGLIDGRVKAIALVSPNNPTGAIYPPAVIQRFADLARERGLWLILDETYRDFLPGGGRPHEVFAGGAEARDHVIQLYSFSKAYGIPGHRLGSMLAPKRLVPEIAKVLDCLQISAPRVPQAGLIAVMDSLDPTLAANRDEIAARAVAFRATMAGLNGFTVHSAGAYFAYVEHGEADGVVVARRMATELGVLALPGAYFGPGQERFLRFAYANVGRAAISGVGPRLAL